jgi:hypothetical protein
VRLAIAMAWTKVVAQHAAVNQANSAQMTTVRRGACRTLAVAISRLKRSRHRKGREVSRFTRSRISLTKNRVIINK